MTSTARLAARMYVGRKVYLPRHSATVTASPTASLSAEHIARVIAASKARSARDIEWLRQHTPLRLVAVALAHVLPVVAVVTTVGVL